MILDAVATAQELVRIPSVNPMGGEAAGDAFYEHAVTDYLEAQFRALGVSFVRQPVAPRRDNIVVCVGGDPPPERGGKILLWEVHQDTVPVDRMTIDPWGSEIKDGRIYGRGACDVKGGMAAMLAAFSRLLAEKPAPRPTVVLACTVDEEFGTTGVKRLVELWNGGPTELFPRAPDAAIVAEPTMQDVVTAHKGALRWRCHTLGKSCHSSAPQLGENAIYSMARVLAALEAYAASVSSSASHPLLGAPTLSVGVIRGGFSVNAVPDRCTIEIDRRLLPGEYPDAALAEAKEQILQHAAGASCQHEPPFTVSLGLSDDNNQLLAAALSRVAQAHGGPGRLIGVPYGTDAPSIAASGVPTVVFGPGSIDQAHTADEWIAIEQLQQCADVLFDFCRSEFFATG